MADFSNMTITTAENGFMVETACGGPRRVFRDFAEAAEYFGGPQQPLSRGDLRYGDSNGKHTLREVYRLYRVGEKINAIKLMRDMYSTRLSLREAKELVEIMCEE